MLIGSGGEKGGKKLTLKHLLYLLVILCTGVSLIYGIVYNDYERLRAFPLRPAIINRLHTLYIEYLPGFMGIYSGIYATILFTYFPAQFEEAFANGGTGTNSRLLLLLKDFNLLPPLYAMPGSHNDPFRFLRDDWVRHSQHHEVIGQGADQVPRVLPTEVYVPREFREMMMIGPHQKRLSFSNPMEIFMYYVNHYPLTGNRKRAFTAK